MYSPMALPRSFSGKMSATIAIPLASIPATPIPWIIFAAISTGNAIAVPPIAAATTKTPNPSMNTWVRPKISDSLPTGMNITLVLSVNPRAIHCAVGKSAPKCSAMRGSAMLTPDWSVTVRNSPSATDANTHHL